MKFFERKPKSASDEEASKAKPEKRDTTAEVINLLERKKKIDELKSQVRMEMSEILKEADGLEAENHRMWLEIKVAEATEQISEEKLRKFEDTIRTNNRKIKDIREKIARKEAEVERLAA